MDSNRDHRRNNQEKQIVEICNNHKYVPIDLTVEILSRLPIKSIGRFMSASKRWHDMITSRRFSFTYAKNNPFSMFYMSYPSLYRRMIEVYENSNSLTTIVQLKRMIDSSYDVVGSCNGLLCLRESRQVFVILNPITSERGAITIPNDDHGWGAHNMCAEYHGFGYSQSTNEYKLFKGLRISHGGELRDEYAIFTVGVDERWRKLPPNLFPGFDKGMCDDPVVCNGAFHWLVDDKFEDHSCVHILAFDIATENTTRRIPTPQKSRMHSRLMALRDRLCLATRSDYTSIWRIEHYGDSSSGSHTVVPADSIVHACSLEARELFNCATRSGKLVFTPKTSGHRLGLYCPKQMSHNLIPFPYRYDVTRLYELTPTFSSINEIVYGTRNYIDTLC